MALSQLITTIDIPNNNIGVGNIVANGSSNAVALGNGQNVGIGTDNPVAGLHIGSTDNTIPALYVADASSSTLPTVAAGDGIFSALAGVPTFTDSAGPKTLFTVSSDNVGTATLTTGGTVTVTAPIVTTSSIISLTRTGDSTDVTTIGTLSVVPDNGFFTVKSTVETDGGSFIYFVINI